MTQEEVEQIIERARVDRSEELNLSGYRLNYQLKRLPESIEKLTNLTTLRLQNNQLTSLPESIGKLSRLTYLNLDSNQLASLPESICNLLSLSILSLTTNRLTKLPRNIDKLVNLTYLHLIDNQLTDLPKSINFLNLRYLNLRKNPINDLSNVRPLATRRICKIDLDTALPLKYWTKFSDWKPELLLNESNAEVRRVLIEQIGYERICQELNINEINNWREYTLLKIDGAGEIYFIPSGGLIDPDGENNGDSTKIIRIPMVLLKMTCPSTGHIHILRVPPEMTSAEVAITWVNHGIHPDEFAVQT